MISPYEIQFVLKPLANDASLSANLMAMQKVIQDASTDHASLIGYGKTEMDALNVFWAIARLRVSFFKSLVANETYSIKTWPNPYEAVGIDRNYLVFDSKGDLVVQGMGKWVIVDKSTFKLVKPKQFALTSGQNNPLVEKVYPDGYRRYSNDHPNITFQLDKYVHMKDIDQNGHVNNVVYLDYIFSTIHEWNPSPLTITEYQINYSESLFKNDRFKMQLVDCDDHILLSAYRVESEGNSLVFQALIQKK